MKRLTISPCRVSTRCLSLSLPSVVETRACVSPRVKREEKIDRLLEQKRDLAAKVVGTGEQWITELGNSELRDLFALSQDAVVGSDDGEDDSPPPPRKRAVRKRKTEVQP
jgi:hypothetical protein